MAGYDYDLFVIGGGSGGYSICRYGRTIVGKRENGGKEERKGQRGGLYGKKEK